MEKIRSYVDGKMVVSVAFGIVLAFVIMWVVGVVGHALFGGYGYGNHGMMMRGGMQEMRGRMMQDAYGRADEAGWRDTNALPTDDAGYTE